MLLNLVIDHAVEHRRGANTLQFDPVVVRLLSEHEPFQRFIERLYGMLVGDEPGPDTQVRLAALTCVIGGTVSHPLVLTSMTTLCAPNYSRRRGALWACRTRFRSAEWIEGPNGLWREFALLDTPFRPIDDSPS